jgi:L-threonylcarbamoyladenylate synthase
MSRVFEVDPENLSGVAEALDAAAEAIDSGLLVVMPTETVYGILCKPDDPQATRRLFEAKHRPTGLNLPVLASTTDVAWEIGEPADVGRRLAQAFWPGPLTMVLGRTERSSPWWLGDRSDSIGVRVPDHPLSLELLVRSGPLAATSANLSGQPTSDDAAELVRTFSEAVAVLVVLAPGATPGSGSASTVVDLTSGPMRLLREGAIGAAQVLRVATG